MFSCQHLDFNLIYRNRTCKYFENRSIDKVLMAKMNFEYEFCISKIIHGYEFSFNAMILS